MPEIGPDSAPPEPPSRRPRSTRWVVPAAVIVGIVIGFVATLVYLLIRVG